jgi:hypothetical protein
LLNVCGDDGVVDDDDLVKKNLRLFKNDGK